MPYIVTGWFHMVIVLHGTENGDGFSLYHNATEVARDRFLANTGYNHYSEPDITVGSNSNSVIGLDEFIIWLEELDLTEIQTLFNSYL